MHSALRPFHKSFLYGSAAMLLVSNMRFVAAFADNGQVCRCEHARNVLLLCRRLSAHGGHRRRYGDQGAQQPVPSFSELAAALQPARLLESASEGLQRAPALRSS